jgi:DNA-binding MarR family transcriptional regulator
MPFYDLPTFNPDVSVGYLAKRIHQSSMIGLEQAFAGEDISYLQWAALVSILYGRGSTCKALARDIAHDRGATTRLLDTLEELRLVVRERDPNDRRIINLTLTETGEATARRCLARVVDLWNAWLADWDAADVAQLILYLQRLRKTLEDATTAEDVACA